MSRLKLLVSIALLVALGSVEVAADSNLNANAHATSVSNSMPGVGVDPSTGAVATRIAVNVPPGRNGIAPELALEYSSLNSTNGIAGYGWSVSLEAIERSANKGVPTYSGTDEFFLHGSMRSKLVHIGGDAYRPDIETAFSRIQFVGDSYWVITDKKGTRSFFGQAPESRVADPAMPGHVYRYLLDRVEDVHGNYMTISYTQFSGNEDKYPLEVHYTGHTSLGSGVNPAPYAKVEFVYEAQARPDFSFSYLPGFQINHTKRLDRIDVRLTSGELQRRYDLIYTLDPQVNKSYLSTIRQVGSDGTLALPDTRFEYSGLDADFHPVINVPPGVAPAHGFSSGTVRMLDFDGDGCDDFVYGPPGGAPWQWYRSDCTGGFLAPVQVQNSPPFPIKNTFYQNVTANDMRFEDFTGDGLLDVVQQPPGTMAYLWKNNGQGGFYPPSPSNILVDRDVKYVDMNGDGLVDVLFGDPQFRGIPWSIIFNSGNGEFDTSTIVVNAPDSPVGGVSGNYYLEYSDYNGDGLIDVTRANRVWINNGQNGYRDSVIDHDLPGNIVQSSYFGFLYKPDLNGDGLIDLLEIIDHCYPAPDCYPVYHSQGDGAFSTEYLISNLASNGGFMFFDLNGDGLTDVLTSKRTSSSDVWGFNVNDNGKGFLLPTAITEHHASLHFSHSPGFPNPEDIELVLADVNGDSRMDIVYGGDPDFGGPAPLQYQVWIGKTEPRSARSGVLVAIDNSVGFRTEFTYKAQPVRGRRGAQYGYAHHSFKIEAVATKVDIVAVSGAQYTTTYAYEGGLWDEEDREFRGFAKVTQTDDEGNYVVTKMHQDDLLQFRPFEVATYGSNSQLFSKTVNTWTSQNLNPGVYFVFRAEANEYTYDGNETGRRIKERFFYGDTPQYGNLTRHIEWGEVDLVTGADVGTDARVTDCAYTSNVSTSTYLAGFPSYIVRKDFALNKMRESWMYYDGATSHVTPPTRGLLTKEERWNDAGTNPQTVFTYDAYGNRLTTLDAEENLTTTSYDAERALLPLAVTDALLHVQGLAYYGIDGEPLNAGGFAGLFGQLKSTTDANAAATAFTYDALGRTTRVIGPLDWIALPTAEMIYTPVLAPGAEHWVYTIKRRIVHLQPETLDTYEFHDGMGRVIQSKAPMEAAGAYSVSGQTEYDSHGRPERIYAPFGSTAPATAVENVVPTRPHTSFVYDPMGRETQRTNADGSYASIIHDDWVVTRIDENGHQKKEHFDAFVRPNRIEEYRGADGRAAPTYAASSYSLYATSYVEHNSEGEVDTITDDHNNVTSLLYDKLGRTTYLTEPNTGALDYEHDLNGNVLWQLDAKAQTINLSYDVLNRVDTKSYPQSSVPTVDYVYDAEGVPFAKGRLTNVVVTTSQRARFAYDAHGRQNFLRQIIDNEVYDVQTTYDALNHVRLLTYPDAHQIQYGYNNGGAVESVVDLAGVTHIADVDYDAQGNITDIYFGNGVHTAYTYDPDNFRLRRTLTQTATDVLQDLSYDYDPLGNLTKITNGITALAETFVYDELNRVVQATGRYCDGATCTKTFAYDEVGNITQKDGLTYTYGENAAGPHAVTSVSDGSTMEYDANGNMTRQQRPWGEYEYIYDRENRVERIRKNGALAARYGYDDRGQRVKATVYYLSPGGPGPQAASLTIGPITSQVTTHFVENLFEKRTDNGLSTRHVYLGPLRIVSISSDGQTRYVHTDHLKGTNVTTDNTGREKERIEYSPFGEVVLHTVSGAEPEDAYFQYAGQRFDEESGLLFMQARYYDPKLGRFLTPDSIIPDMSNPQAFNRYAYAYNNPIRLVDPTGHSPQETDDDEEAPSKSADKQEANGQSSSPQTGGVDTGPKTDVIVGNASSDSPNSSPDARVTAANPLQESRPASDDKNASESGGFLSGVGQVLGFIWNLPNTLIGVVYGILGIPTDGVGVEYGQMQFKGNLLNAALSWLLTGSSQGAITLGDAGIYSSGFGPDTRNAETGQRLGLEESFHSAQGRILGPLYLPAHMIGGAVGLFSGSGSDRWHSSGNFMEQGPHSVPPRRW